MIILFYGSKKVMAEQVVGKSLAVLSYQETSMFGEEVSANCTVTGSNRPSITRITTTNKNGVTKRANEFFANITIKDGIIIKVL